MPRGREGRDAEEPLLEHEPTDGNSSKKRSTLLTVCPYILGKMLDLLPHSVVLHWCHIQTCNLQFVCRHA